MDESRISLSDAPRAEAPAGWRSTGFAIAVALALGAALLRAWNLGGRGLWYDEAFSVQLARLPLPAMAAATARDIHPPLYYALLQAWIVCVGDGEVALRALSTGFGVLGVLLAYRLGTEMGGRRLAVPVAALAGLSPFLVLYAQETRMYTLLVAAVTAAALFAWRAATLQPAKRWALGYVVAATVAAYAHNTAPFSLAGFNLAYLVVAGPPLWVRWRRQGRGGLIPGLQWLACQLAVLVAFLPWLPVLWEQNARYVKPGAGMAPDALLNLVAQAFVAGEVPAAGTGWVATAAWVGVAGGLLLTLLKSLRRRTLEPAAVAAIFAAVWLGAGLALLYVAVAGKRDFSPRYIVVVLPAFYLLLAASAAALARLKWPLGVLSAGVLLVPMAQSLEAYYRDPYAGRPDQRAAISAMEAMAGAGDGVVLNAPYLSAVYDYYQRRALPAVGLPANYPPDRSATEAALADAAGKYKRLWLLLWQEYYADPDAIVDTWLRDNAIALSDDRFYGGVKLRGYETRQSGDTVFGGLVRLEGYELVDFKAGWQAKVRLRWRCLAPVGADYQVFVHVVDDNYRFYGQQDGAPNGGQSPTSTWHVGDLVEDEHLVQLPADSAGQALTVRVGLYRLADGVRLTSTAGDNLVLAHAPVQPGN